MASTNRRLRMPERTWEKLRAVAAWQELPPSVLCALLIRNYVAKPWKLELLPERRDEDKE